MDILSIIDKKRLREELSFDELSYAFNGYLNKEIPDYQMSALLMAIVINGLSFEETYNLTKIFIDSGKTYKYDIKTVDKHSTGGIGDTVTLVVAPILASLNVPIAKMSGKGLGITGGTIDKLESIPGYKTNLSYDDYHNYLKNIKVAVGSQTDELVPLDKVIYALRDVTGTTESIPLIVSSIMSKKIASGANIILIDVKCGEGALVKTKEDASKLADLLVEIGKKFNVKVKTIITDMDEPLGDSIGNALEVLEAIDTLNGKKNKLYDICVHEASILNSLYKNIDIKEAEEEVRKTIDNKNALNKFNEWIKNQGGDLSKVKLSDKRLAIKANKDGIIKNISALKIGKLALKLGTGKINKEDIIEYSVGIKLLKRTGETVKKGDTLAILYVKDLDIKLDNNDLNAFIIK